MTELTDKMRTCAAHIIATAAAERHLYNDAADLLIEASNVIEAIPEPLGTPMDILTPKPPVAPLPALGQELTARTKSIPPIPDRTLGGDNDELYRQTHKGRPIEDIWRDPGVPTGKPSVRPNRVCPKCDSRTNKRVFRDGAKLFLSCPVCAAAWEYRP